MRSNHYREAVARYFRDHPREWVSCYTLMEIGGKLAWRTRCSEVRKVYGMTIETKETRDERGVKTTWRRYVPAGPLRQAGLWEERA